MNVLEIVRLTSLIRLAEKSERIGKNRVLAFAETCFSRGLFLVSFAPRSRKPVWGGIGPETDGWVTATGGIGLFSGQIFGRDSPSSSSS